MTPMNIVFIGFMGTGKSAIGQALALRLNASYLDTDDEIERAAGKPIRRLFAEDGEEAFRARETALLERLVAAPASSGSVTVIATGGGLPLRAENVRLLRRLGRVIWLKTPAAEILRRVGPDLSLRPLLAPFTEDPLGRIESLLAARGPHYAAAADLDWDTSLCLTPEDAAAALAEKLCQSAAQLRLGPTETV